jgi:ribose transport system substrate-binding protein
MEMIIPAQASAAEQRRILDELLARRVAGVAISPSTRRARPRC